MTALDLSAIEARANAATAPPWKICPDEDSEDLELICCGGPYEHGGPICTHLLTGEDAEFIAAARTDIPALVAEVKRLRGEVYEAHGHLQADGGVAEQDCECEDCIEWRKAESAAKRASEETP